MESNETVMARSDNCSCISDASTDALMTSVADTARAALLGTAHDTEHLDSLKGAIGATKPMSRNTLAPSVRGKTGSDPYIRTANYGIYELVEEVHPVRITNVNVSKHYEATKVSSHQLLHPLHFGDSQN